MVRFIVSGVVLLAMAACAPEVTTPPDIPCVIPDVGLPTDLFCTGLYTARGSDVIADGVMPYAPGALFWSDGAEKHRYLSLPADTQIDTTDLDDWQFPVDTKAWKDFRLDGKLVETRLFWKRAEDTWALGTYIWNDAETEATLNTAQRPTLLSSGYEIPTAKDCDKCHHGASDQLLGVEAVALALPGATGATLEQLASNDLLTHPPVRRQVALPADATGKSAAALAYLHVNCGACHSTRGIGQETELLLRVRAGEMWPDGADGDVAPIDITETDIWKATIDKTPTTASVAQHFPGAKRVTPGAHDQSLVWLMSHVRDKYQMPPLVSHKVDDEGSGALADWIDALSSGG